MKLLTIEVWNWRGVRHVLLDGLVPGLNIIDGPNEAGKSRVFEALRWCLFERYKGRGRRVEELVSWQGGNMPEVAVTFQAEPGPGQPTGARWRIHKRFLRGEFATLEGPGGPYRGSEAEERLSQLLGTRGTKRASKMEDRGLWPLLWLEQHDSRTPPHEHITDDASHELRQLLLREVGEATAGSLGQRVIQRAKAEYQTLWTNTGREPKARKDLRLQVEQADRELDLARTRRDEVHTAVEVLDLASAAEQKARTEVRRLRDTVAREDERFRDSSDVEARIDAARARHDELQGRRELLIARLSERTGLAQAARQADTAARNLADQLDQARAALDSAQRNQAAAEGALQGARAAVRAAEEAQRRAVRQSRRATATHHLAQLDERIKAAMGLDRRISKVQRELEGNRLGGDTLTQLDALNRAAERAEARLDAASTGVVLTAHSDLTVDGEPLPASDTRQWAFPKPGAFDIEGIGRVEVRPGGEGMADLVRNATQQRKRFDDRLSALGVRDLAEARAVAERRALADQQLAEARRQLEALAPEGVDALRSAYVLAESQLRGLGPDDPRAPDAATAEAQLSTARAECDLATAARERASTSAGHHREAAARLDAQLEAVRRDGARANNQLALLPPEEAAQAELTLVQERLEEAHIRLAQLQGEAVESGGAAARAALGRLGEQLEAATEAEKRSGIRAAQQLGIIEAHAAHDLHEHLQEAGSRADRLRARLADVERRAAAAERLHEALQTARRETQERLLEPVIQHVQPHIHTLFAGSQIDIDDRWQILGIRSADRREQFHHLSGGAQEQVSVLVRVGLAQVLAGSERLPLVLDDALVNTDPDRRARIVHTLDQVTDRLQILLFTSQPVPIPPGAWHKTLEATRAPATPVASGYPSAQSRSPTESR